MPNLWIRLNHTHVWIGKVHSISGISTIHSFSHTLGVWNVFPDDKVGLLYRIFGVISKKSLPKPRSQNVCIFQDIIWYYIEIYHPFWLNFNIMQNIKLYLYLMWISICVKTICWKTTFSALNFLCTFLINELFFHVWMYFGILFCLIDLYVYHCYWYYAILKTKIYSEFQLFSNCSTCLVLLPFHKL